MHFSISSNLLTALVSGLCLVVGALGNGFWVYRTARQKNANEFVIATADSIRKDNERLARRVDETSEENADLLARLTACRAERELLEGERNTFRAASQILRALFEELLAGRPPSREKLASIKTRLESVGFFSAS